jgi:hypothetical protein
MLEILYTWMVVFWWSVVLPYILSDACHLHSCTSLDCLVYFHIDRTTEVFWKSIPALVLTSHASLYRSLWSLPAERIV